MEDLQRRLRECTISSPFDKRYFVPNCHIKRLITRANISNVLGSIRPDFPLEETFTVIAILVFLGQLNNNTLECLAQNGFTDNLLPVTYHPSEDRNAILHSNHTGRAVDLSTALNDISCMDFCEDQWRFLAPVVGGETHSQYDENIALPIIEKGRKTFNGSYGQVFQVRIHHAHLKLREGDREPTQEQNPHLALKELESDDLEDFTRERTALERIQQLRHNHLINFVGSFEKGDTTSRRFYFLFPWASGGNLKGFWSDPAVRSHERRSPTMMRWALSQIKGLTSGVAVLHGAEATSDENGRHGDLRPENILLFRDDPARHGSWGTLQITDAGLARFHQQITRKRLAGTSTHGGSIEYAPPEGNHEGEKRGRRYDMWSLGCILLEFAVWILGGIEDVNEFRTERASISGLSRDRRENPPFYRTKRDDSYRRHPDVEDRMRAIRRDRSCPPCLQDLLKVIEDGLLQIEENKRFYAQELDQRIEEILERCNVDSYLCVRSDQGERRGFSFSDVLRGQRTRRR